MKTRRLPTAVNHFLGITMLATLGTMGLSAVPAAASDADACGLVTQHETAKAFDLTNSIPHHVLLRAPGNPAGVVHVRCRAFAWSGPKPTNAARRRAGLLAGTVANLRIETWVADSGPSAQTWLANFPKKLEGLKSRSKAQFIEGALRGTSLRLPHFGAEAAIGYQATSGGTRKLRAFWWDSSSGTLVSFNAVETRDKPLVAGLRELASKIVPGVG
ncbi:MAG TPA: hypothetical protein VII45_01935 [Solirubrobacterales bacterium]